MTPPATNQSSFFLSMTTIIRSTWLFSVCALLCAMPTVTAAVEPPMFTATFTNHAVVPSSPNQESYAPHLNFPAEQPVQTTGPADITNATQVYVQFLSNSLGSTNLSDATAQTAFHLAGTGQAAIPGIVDAPANPNTNNLFYSALGNLEDNQVWLMINLTPGTNTAIVTNTVRIIAVNGNINQSINWAETNLALVVRPSQALPPYLEVRFYNSSTNDDSDVFILPTCKGLSGNGFWWVKDGVTNNWTNWITTTTNMTVALADIGVSGTNTQNKPYYAIFTTHFPNAAWFVSYGGGHLMAPTNSSGKWNGRTDGAGSAIAQPTAANTGGLWFGYEWNAFELTLDGNPEDVGDTTYINQFSIPMAMRVYSNSYTDAEAGIYTNKDSSQYYQMGGWTNFNASQFSNFVAQMKNAFPNGIITNAAGTPVMIPGPSAAQNGTVAIPWTPPPFTNDAHNIWPTFASYFDAVKQAQTSRSRKANIKDYIGLAGGTNTFFFYYDFDLTVTDAKALRLEGSMMVTNAPGSAIYYTTNSNLVMQIAADAGPSDNWASWSIYTAPTPANLSVVHDLYDLASGTTAGQFTNLTTYSPYAANALGGTAITLTGSNFTDTVQVAFCGVNNTLIPSPYFTVSSDTNLTVYVPYGAASGPIVVTTKSGSGMSSQNISINGTTLQPGPTLTPAASSPVITAIAPTSGIPAEAICTISGDWLEIATQTQTGSTNGDNSVAGLYNSPFGSAVMGRIAGDLAAGFALGFINSDTVNGAYAIDGTNALYGDSPSGSWWGGNQYPASSTNELAFDQVNTQYSLWGRIIHDATAVTYGHPIYDRMQVYSGRDQRMVIQPHLALNYDPNIWMAEVEFYDGMSSVGFAAPATPHIDILGTNHAAIDNGEAASPAKGTAFGHVDLNTAVTNTFSITNAGSAALTLSSVITGGTHAAFFAATGIPSEIHQGAVHPFSIAFTPATTGDFSATLTIISDATNSPYIINLSGSGVSRQLATVTISQTNQIYNGTARPVTVTTDPTGLTFTTTYAGLAWAPTNAGTYAVTTTVDEAAYTGSASSLLTISKADQTITFTPPGHQIATNQLGLQVSALSGLAVTCSVISGNAIVSGYTNVQFTGSGNVELQAGQSGDANWNAAPYVMTTVTVSKADQTIAFPAIASQKQTSTLTLSASASSGLAVSFALNYGSAVISGSSMTFSSTGTVSVAASQAGDDIYNPADDVVRTFNVYEYLRRGTAWMILLLDK